MIAIPFKRHQPSEVSYLNLDEIKALLAAPDRTTWLGRRDHALLLPAIQTGVRVSELATLRIGDVSLDHRRAHQGRRQRAEKERPSPSPARPSRSCASGSRNAKASPRTRCSPPAKDRPLTRYGVASLLAKHTATAARQLPIAERASASPRTRSGITWTAGLCGRLACFPCWACR